MKTIFGDLKSLDNFHFRKWLLFFQCITRTITHLSLLRLQPGYLERLIGMMQDLRRQGNRSRAKVIELTAAVEQANEELNTLHSEMTDCLKERKQLVAFVSF